MRKFSSWRNVLCFYIPAFIVLAAVIFYEPIVYKIFEWQFKRTCRECLGGDLQAEKIYREGSRWILEKPWIASAREDRKEGRLFKANRVEIDFSFSLAKRQIGLDVSLADPYVELDDPRLQAGIWPLVFNGESSYFKINGTVSVQRGIFSFRDAASEHTVSFKGNAEFGSKLRADGELAFGDPSIEANRMKVEVSGSDGSGVKYSVRCSTVDLSMLTRVLKFPLPSLKDWEVSKGVLDGSISVLLSEGKKPYAEGTLNVSDLAFANIPLEIKGNVGEARLAVNQNALGNKEHPSIGRLEILKEGSLELLNGNSTIGKVQHLLGGIWLDTQEHAKVSFVGICYYEGLNRSLQIEGEARFPEEPQASLDLACRLSSFKSDDVLARFVARKAGPQKGYAEVELKNCTQQEIHFLQSLLGRHAPIWNQFYIRSGSIDSSLYASIDHAQLIDLKIESLSAKNLEMTVFPWNLDCKIAAASGHLSVNPSQEDILSTLDAVVSLSDGQLRFVQPGHENWRFTDIQGSLAVHQGVLHKSLIKGGFAGLRGEVEADWSSPSEVMKLTFTGGTEMIAKLMPEVIRQGAVKKFGGDTLKIAAGVERVPQG